MRDAAPSSSISADIGLAFARRARSIKSYASVAAG